MILVSSQSIKACCQENVNINDNVQLQEDMPKSILKDLKVPMFLQAIPEQESEGGNSSTTNNSKKDEEKQQLIIEPQIIKSEIENSLQLQSVQNQNDELKISQTQEDKLEKTYNISPKNSIVQIQEQQQIENKVTSPQKIYQQETEEENYYKNSQFQLQSQNKNYQEKEQQIAQQQDDVNNSQYSQKISPVKNYSIQSYRDSRLLKKKNQQHQQQELQQTVTNESQHSISLLQNESIKQSYIQNDNHIPQQEKSVLDQLKLQPGIPESILKKSMEYSKISNVSKRGSHPKVAWNFQEEVNQSKISIKDKKHEISNQSIKLKRSQLQNQSFKKTIQTQQQQQSKIFNQSQEIQKGVDVAKLQNEELEKKIREQEFKFQQQQQQDLEKKKKNQQEEERKRLEEEKKLNERIKKMEEQIQKDEKLKQDKLKKLQEEQKKAEQEKIQHQKFIDEQIKIDEQKNTNLHKQSQNQNQNTNININTNKVSYSSKGQEIFFQNSEIYKKNQNMNTQDKNQNQDENLEINKNKKYDENSQNLKNTFQSNLLEEILQSDQKQIQNSQSKLINSQKQETSQSQEPQFDASERGLDKLKLFDLTNQGRFQPAERTRFGQSKQDILEIQNEVQNTVRQVQKLEEEFNFSKINQNQQQNKLYNDQKVGLIQLNQQNNSSIQNLNQSQKQQEIKATQNQNQNQNLQNQVPKNEEPEQYDDLEEFLKKELNYSNLYNDILKEQTPVVSKKQSSQQNNQEVDQNQSQLEKTLKIPKNPQGKIIELTIFSTWADKYYVGLNGIEFFDENGDLIKIANPKQQITANPPDINILPQYENDPRIVQNLVDGIYNTRDDLHVWLAPYNQENVNKIWIDFDKSVKLSAIRIWNYNKSRIHSFRGAKEIQIKFDEQIIFSGEIQKAPGQLNKIEKLFEFISFTNSLQVLENIENNDQINFNMDLYKKNSNQLENNSNQLERPNTGNNNNEDLKKNDNNTEEHDDNQLSNILKDQQGRPLTIVNLKQQLQFEKSLKNNENKLKGSQLMDISWNHKANNQIKKQNQQSKNTNLPKKKEIKQFIKCRKLTINILQSWGDQYYVGLNGIQFFDQNNQVIELSKYNIDAKPKDLNSIPGYSSDKRILSNLINNQNISQKDENIWLIQYIPQESHYIYIDFHKDVYISGVKIYNYNKNKEDVIRGVKLLNIQVENNQYITPKEGILIRQAPGSDILDFGQYIELPYLKGWSKEQIDTLYKPNMPPINNIVQEYDTLHMPQGMNIKMSILSTYGDIFYVGLNGIEILDHQGNPVIQNKQIKFQIAAEPSSINIIPGHENDIRTIDKLVNGQNETQDDRNMWLTPLVSKKDQDQDDKKINAIFLYLEQPVIISAIKFWNYTKTPNRGVKEIEISLDDHIIYKGYIKKASKIEEQTQNSDKPYTTILFNKYPMLVQKIQPQVYTEDNQYQDVVMYNEKKLVSAPQSQNNNQQSQFNNFNTQTNRPSTKVKGLEYKQNLY
ncbi:hypothetical protein PPERSA_08880 [Pseudocohnilembus persalinus]|uniref:KATNIP domain-containing protein n=1 Tax=Pseudocohnilembus persalinus TaxID=266149 RepID=A0A0V0R3V2_PSEPJ|nr:hypothetical protein PPERSA_08880 [Pseudocohnilembus persalinus]|eukprot:KRX09164.1 hypothetical protein PPERSA_08880 [Pseudocohnilembus persalinus]